MAKQACSGRLMRVCFGKLVNVDRLCATQYTHVMWKP